MCTNCKIYTYRVKIFSHLENKCKKPTASCYQVFKELSQTVETNKWLHDTHSTNQCDGQSSAADRRHSPPVGSLARPLLLTTFPRY